MGQPGVADFSDVDSFVQGQKSNSAGDQFSDLDDFVAQHTSATPAPKAPSFDDEPVTLNQARPSYSGAPIPKEPTTWQEAAAMSEDASKRGDEKESNRRYRQALDMRNKSAPWYEPLLGAFYDAMGSGGMPGQPTPGPTPGTNMRQGMERMRTPGERATGALQSASETLNLATPMLGPAALESFPATSAAVDAAPSVGRAALEIAKNPIVRGMGEGYVASKAGGYGAEKLGATPEQKQYVEDLAFWAPGVARSTATMLGVDSPSLHVQSGEDATGVGVMGKGGTGAAVAVGPEGVTVSGRFRGGEPKVRTFGGGAKPSAPGIEPPTIEGQTAQPAPASLVTQAASSMVAKTASETQAARVVSGLPPTPPEATPPAPPTPPPVHEIGADEVQKIAGLVAQLPPELRAKAIVEAHGTLTKVLQQQGKIVGPDGKLEVIRTPQDADRIAQRWINQAVADHDKAQADAAKEKPAPAQAEPYKENAVSQAAGLRGQQPDFSDIDQFVQESHLESKTQRSPVEGTAAPVEAVGTTQPKTGREAFRKGDRVELADGTKATVIFAHPEQGIVRVRTDDGHKVATGISRIKPLTEKAETVHKHNSSQINLPTDVATKVMEAGKQMIPDKDLAEVEGSDSSAAKGREGQPHITVKYGVSDDAEAKLRDKLADVSPFEAKLGKVRVFPPSENSDGAAVAHAQVESPELKQLHDLVNEHASAKADDFDYKPHVTLAYVKPEAAHKYEGRTDLEGTKIPVNSVTISKKDGTQVEVPLGGKSVAPPHEEGKAGAIEASTQVPTAPAPSGTPEPGKVGEMKVSDLKVAPSKFQYKLSTDAEGVSPLLKNVRVFNPDLAGQISVWRDPADGKTYVVNGHHRFELAKRTGQKTVVVRHIKASDAVAARAIGAQQNIAEGRGTAIDAAKYMRDTSTTAEDLNRNGISLGEATAQNAVALSKLDTPIFNKVVSGDLRQGRAIAIGEATGDPAEQKAVLDLVNRRERGGGRVSDETLSELIRLVKSSGQTTETTADLFGSQEISRSLAIEKAEISAHVKQQLSRDKKLFGFVAKEGRAQDLERGGNKIDVDKSRSISTGAAQAEEVYNKLSERGGPISGILDESARRLADGDNAGTVKSEAYQRVRAEISKTLGSAEAGSAGRSEGAPSDHESTEDATGKPQGPIDLFSAEDQPAFYSKSERVVADKVANAASGDSILATLRNNGVKEEEIKWIGLDDFLRGKPRVTKQELQEFIRENEVQVRDVAHPNPAERQTREGLEAKRERIIAGLKRQGLTVNLTGKQYEFTVRPGSRMESEIKSSKPEKVLAEKIADLQKIDQQLFDLQGEYEGAPGPAGTHYADFTLPGDKRNYTELLLTLPKPLRGAEDRTFTTSHFDEPNVLAHVRFDERTDAAGKRVLLVEEVQSDWHQKGKKQGYAATDRAGVEKQLAELTAKQNELADLARDAGSQQEADSYVEQLNSLGEEAKQIRDSLSGPPKAPFKSDWHELVMKRMMRWAAEHGYDKLAWVTGEQTAQRYGLAEGEWAKNLYDRAISNFVSKYAKKWGSTIGETRIPSGLDPRAARLAEVGDEYRVYDADATQRGTFDTRSAAAEKLANIRAEVKAGARVHSVDVTQQMRRSVMEEGQPLFRPAEGELLSSDAKRIQFQQHPTAEGLPPYLVLNRAALILMHRVMGVQFLGVNMDANSVAINGQKLEAIAKKFEAKGHPEAAAKVRELSTAMHTLVDKNDGLILVAAMNDPSDELRVLHEELLHSVSQRRPGQGNISAGVPWRDAITDPGFAKMIAERIAPQHERLKIDMSASTLVAEGAVDLILGSAPELSAEEAGTAATKYFEALADAHGIKPLEDTLAATRYIEKREAAENVTHDERQQTIRKAVADSLQRVYESRRGKEVERGGGEIQQGSRGEGPEGSKPPGAKDDHLLSREVGGSAGTAKGTDPGDLHSTALVGLNDEELESWSRNKGFRVEPAGEQIGLFGDNDKVFRVYRSAGGKQETGLVYENQLDRLGISSEPPAQSALFKTKEDDDEKLGAVRELLKQDVAPALAKAGVDLKDIAGFFVKAIYPRIEDSSFIGRKLGVAVPTDAVDALMKLKGDRARAAAEFDAITAGLEKMFDRLPEESRIDFIDGLQTGKAPADPDLKQIADAVKALQTAERAEEQEAANLERSPAQRVKLPEKENYFHNRWDTPPGGGKAEDEETRIGRLFTPRRPLEGSKGYNKQQSYTLKQGIAAGGKSVTTNPIRLLRLRIEDGMKFVTARRAEHELKKLDLWKYLPRGERIPEGWDTIDDPVAKVYYPAELASGKSTAIEGGRWIVEANTARLLNNMLSRDLIRGNAAGRSIIWLKNVSTAIELGVSPFHAVFETIEAASAQSALGMLRAYNLGLRGGSITEFAKGLRQMLEAPVAPITMAREGAALPAYIEARARLEKIGITEFGHKQIEGKQPHGVIESLQHFRQVRQEKGIHRLLKRYPDLDQLIDDMFTGGLVIGQHQDYQVKMLGKTAMEAWTSGNPLGALVRAVPTVTQGVMKPLFQWYIPNLKYSLFLRLMSEQAAENAAALESGAMTRAEIARRVADSVENRFGELNFDNLFWNRTWKTALQIAFRSVTWKLGTGREILGAAAGQGKEFARWAWQAHQLLDVAAVSSANAGNAGDQKIPFPEGEETGPGLLPKLDMKWASLMGLVLFTTAIGTLASKLLSKKYPWEWAKDAEPEETTGGYAHHLYLETVHPRTGDLDTRQQPVRLSLPTYWKDVEHASGHPAQYVVGSLSTILSKGIDVAHNEDYFGNYVYNPNASLGTQLKQVAKYVEPTPFSISNFQRSKSMGEPKTAWLSAFGFPRAPASLNWTPAETLANALSHKTPRTPEELEAWRQKRAAFDRGELSPTEARQYVRDQRFTWLERQVKKLGYRDALKVYEKANPSEKKMIEPLMRVKRANLLKSGRANEVEAAEE